MGVDPHTIPNGYSIEKHKALKSTIATPGDINSLMNPDLPVMACHETEDAHCIGWLNHQLGEGNNLALRMKMSRCENGHKYRTIGPQHPDFESTLPKE